MFPASVTGVIIPDQARQSDVLRLGRWPDNNIIPDSPGVSRHHATLAYGAEAQPLLTDPGSTSGTFVNGRPVTRPALIAPDDLLAIGGYLSTRSVAPSDTCRKKIFSLTRSASNALCITRRGCGCRKASPRRSRGRSDHGCRIAGTAREQKRLSDSQSGVRPERKLSSMRGTVRVALPEAAQPRQFARRFPDCPFSH